MKCTVTSCRTKQIFIGNSDKSDSFQELWTRKWYDLCLQINHMQTCYPLSIFVFQLALRWRMTICDGGGTVMPPSWPPCQVDKSSNSDTGIILGRQLDYSLRKNSGLEMAKRKSSTIGHKCSTIRRKSSILRKESLIPHRKKSTAVPVTFIGCVFMLQPERSMGGHVVFGSSVWPSVHLLVKLSVCL